MSWFKNFGLTSDFFNIKHYWRSSSLVKEYQNVKAFHVYFHMYHLVQTSPEVYTN